MLDEFFFHNIASISGEVSNRIYESNATLSSVVSIVRAFYVRCENSVLHPGADPVRQHLYGCLLGTQGKGGYLIAPWRFWNMETGVIIIPFKNSKGFTYMFFPCQHLSRTTCQLPLHLFSGNKGTDSSQMSNLYLPDNMPQAFASASNPHNFLSLSLYRDFVKERGLSAEKKGLTCSTTAPR